MWTLSLRIAMLWDKLPHWVRANKFYYSKSTADGIDSGDADAFVKSTKDRTPVSVSDANLVSSRAVEVNGKVYHYPLLDIDFEAALIPSTHPGHYHLYLNRLMPWEDYIELLTVMEKVGIIQSGVLKAALLAEETCLRLPWVKKEPKKEEPKKEGDW